MNSELQKEDILIQIRDKLRKDGVKLWLQPYYDQEKKCLIQDSLQGLAQSCCEALQISVEKCFEGLKELQLKSLENIKQNTRFKESGLASINIKLVHRGSPPRTITKELMLSMRVCDLKDLISKEIHVTGDRLKLINSGKVLADSDSLSSQGVKHGQKMIAIFLSETPTEVQNAEINFQDLETFKTDSRLLAADDQYMQLEDQFGNAINIPVAEKKALTLAMALHAKGQAAMKRDDYSRALVFFLEADEEFKHCNSQLLNTVDNYALVNLDIAWCYLLLQSASHLPEASERLCKCEARFEKSYGPNLERLIAVKGATGNEAALFMRLHLLKAIALYHKNKRAEALELLQRAQRELAVLKVDENSIMSLVELGFTTAEARLGLRASGGDVNGAANYINENREKRLQSRKKAMAEEILEKKRQKLGKCRDGKQYVEPNFVNLLVNMGYNKEAARNALQQCNNIISNSIQFIQENPQPGPSQSRSSELLNLVDELVVELEAAGFDSRMAKLALHKHNGDIMKAAEELLANNGIVDGGDMSVLSNEQINSKSLEEIKQKQQEKDEAFRRLAEDITITEDDHLDLTLTQEEIFLNQYLNLLRNNE